MGVSSGELWVVSRVLRKGVDVLTDDQKRAVRTAALHTADEHADTFEEYLEVTDTPWDDADIPDPFEQSAYEKETESDAELLVVELLLNAAGHESVQTELDELEGKGDTLSEDVFVDALADNAPPDLPFDFQTVAADFLNYLERELASVSDDARPRVKIRNQQRIIDLLETDQREEARKALAERGFEILEPSDLHDGLHDPEYCWRRSFTFTEVYAGIPIERELPGGKRTKVADSLMEDLEGGNSVVLLGEPGAGKTTICKNVACRWYDREDTGPVLYRPHEKDSPVNDPDEVVDAIRKLTGDGPVLVHVEDAARHDSVAVFEAIRELQGDADVSFLLNSRDGEWDRLTEVGGEQGVFDPSEERSRHALAMAKSIVQPWRVPDLDTREIERFIDQFADVTGKSVRTEAEDLLKRIATDEDASRMLLLSYHLPIGDVGEPEGEATSALHWNVEKSYERITAPDEEAFPIDSETERELLEQVALMINILNAAEIGVYEIFVYALGRSKSEYDSIQKLLVRLEGILLYGEHEKNLYLSHHEYWSELYLEVHLDKVDGEKAARDAFERCVNSLLEFGANEDRPEEINEWYGRELQRPNHTDDGEFDRVGELTEAIFEVGVSKPSLAELYGESTYSGIDLPDPLLPELAAVCALLRSKMYHTRGRYRIAENELDVFHERASSVEKEFTEAIYHDQKGRLEEGRGQFDTAREHFEQSLEICRRLEDEFGIAQALTGLGRVASDKGDFDTARKRYEESREHLEATEAPQARAAILNNLGKIAGEQGDFEVAREYHEGGLAIERKIGDRAGMASSFANLGVIARNQGDYEAAREYNEQSLAIQREIGDRGGTASSLANLGNVALGQGDFESAREYHEKSLAIKRQICDQAGVAKSFEGLGLVASNQGDFETAREYHKKGLAIHREIEDRAGVATSLGNLGQVAAQQEDFESAQEFCEESLAIQREIGDRSGAAHSLTILGFAAGARGDEDEALESLEEAYEIFEELGAVRRQVHDAQILAEISSEVGNEEYAVEWCEEALAVIEGSDLDLADERQHLERLLVRLGKRGGRVAFYWHSLSHALRSKVAAAVYLLHRIRNR